MHPVTQNWVSFTFFAFTYLFPCVVITIHINYWHNIEIHVPQKVVIQIFFLMNLSYLQIKINCVLKYLFTVLLNLIFFFE